MTVPASSVRQWVRPAEDKLRKRGPHSSASDLLSIPELWQQSDRSSTSTLRSSERRPIRSPFVERTLRFAYKNVRVLAPIACLLIIQVLFNPLDGPRVDRFLTRCVMARTLERQNAELQARGIILPPVQQEGTANMINTQASLRELLLRRQQRGETLDELARTGDKCVETVCSIPKVVFVPSEVSSKFRPGTIEILTFDETERRKLVQEKCPQTFYTYKKLSASQQTDLWALCALYHYGGYVGDDPHWLTWKESSVDAPVAQVVIMREEMRSLFVAAPPRHPFFRCALWRAGQMEPISTWVGLIEDMPSAQGETSAVVAGQWCDKEKPATCCELVSHEEVESGLSRAWLLYIRFDPVNEGTDTASSTVVEVTERARAPPVQHSKKPLGLILQKSGAEPSWLCNRCMHYAGRGRFHRCSLVCPSSYSDIICREQNEVKKEMVDVQLLIRSRSSTIPRIIHQTWFEDVTLDRYPHLARLQNSWRNSGWEYRFYTDDGAREYILENYPPRFAAAFDSLIHGAYKADLFRYLVLLRDGGIYADIDVMLDATLDSFITSTLTFFATRDIPCEYAGEPYCLWNGFIGSSPGHPFMVQAVERLVNLVQDRADLHDMERDICRRYSNSVEMFETWKVHAQPLLLLSGPCGLGVAVNDALNRPPLQSFDLGWISLREMEYGGERDFGDALILVGDKFDLGAFRISDPERNFIVASTDLKSTSGALDWMRPDGSLPAAKTPHYSDSKKGIAVWGSANVYKDNLVSVEHARFQVRYENVLEAH